MCIRAGRNSGRGTFLLCFIAYGNLNFEKFNAAWIKRELKQKGLNPTSIEVGYRLADVNGYVNPGSTEFELDIYCAKPLVIGEATTFLKRTELNKLESLVRKADFLGKFFYIFEFIES